MFYKITAWVTNALSWLEQKLFKNVGRKIMVLSVLAAVVCFAFCIYLGGKELVSQWESASDYLERYEYYKGSDSDYDREMWKRAKDYAGDLRWEGVKGFGEAVVLGGLFSYVFGLLYYGLGALIDRARQYCDIKRQTNQLLQKLVDANMMSCSRVQAQQCNAKEDGIVCND